MKINKSNIFITITLAAIILLSSCTQGSKAGDKADQENFLLLNLLNKTPENNAAREHCQEAVYYMNECIGASSGFNPLVMCSDLNLNTGTTASATGVTPVVTAATAAENYIALTKCVKTQIAATNCNFPENRVAHPVQAKANFFSTCDAPAGIIITVY